MKNLITFLMLILSVSKFYSQQKTLNLGFEEIQDNLPKNWNTFGEAQSKITPDFTNKKEGKSSIVIENESGNFKALAFTLPNNYEGQKITLSGYMKTENIADGYAGLWMRIDPNIAFDNMQKNGIKGTNDWKKYEVTLKLNPEKTKQIVIGALLVGKGKVWVDDLHVFIDGKELYKAKFFEKTQTKADLDKEFDNGSKINNLSQSNIENLKTVGLIWGFLKYYHPNVSTGDYNWDYELLRILPKINNVSTSERDQILTDWINSFGDFSVVKNQNVAYNVKMKPDLDWISKSNFSEELSSILLKVKDAKRKDSNYYIGFFDGVGNPNFKNENKYENMKFPDEGFRLLTLFRYWNMIQYYFPYKNLIEEDWKNVLTEFIPKFLENKNETDYTLTTLELIGRIHDTHANIWSKSEALKNHFGSRIVPAELTFIGDKAVVKDFYDDNLIKEMQLQIGDVITEINGKSTDEIIKDYLKYLPASNYPTQLRDLARKILRTNEQNLSLKIERNGNIQTISSKTVDLKDIQFKKKTPEDYFKMIDSDVAYFYMGSIKSDNLDDVMKQIKDTKGLVIDFRSYPSDFMVFTLGKLLKPNSTEFVKFSMTNQKYPGLFNFSSSLKVPGISNYYKGKIAILVNETTQSSAEYHTMAFRTAPNAKVFGSTTAGADGNVSSISLPGGIETKISGIGIYYPDGKETQRIGIIPDIEVKPTIEGIKTGKDEVLEKAIYWINNE